MTYYEITYIRTGSGERKDYSKVWIWQGDERKDGSKVSSMIDAVNYFEELAENWGTYETKHAITEIKVNEVKA